MLTGWYHYVIKLGIYVRFLTAWDDLANLLLFELEKNYRKKVRNKLSKITLIIILYKFKYIFNLKMVSSNQWKCSLVKLRDNLKLMTSAWVTATAKYIALWFAFGNTRNTATPQVTLPAVPFCQGIIHCASAYPFLPCLWAAPHDPHRNPCLVAP